jgi:hypothetical protein
MPILAAFGQADVMAVLNHIGKHQDLWITRLQVRFCHVDFECAKAAAKGDVLLLRELLVTKDDHATIVEDALDSPQRFMIREH